LMDLLDAVVKGVSLDDIVQQFREVLAEARHHSEYPMAGLAQMLQELGNIPQISEAFGTVIEDLIEIERSRSGESAEGQLRLQRGLQLLKQEKTYESITQIARAQILLAKEETYGDFVQAVAVTGLAFEAAGLLWAARGNILTAFERAMASYGREGKIAQPALALCRKLVWLELQLGRPTWVQVWWEWLAILQRAEPLDERRQAVNDEEMRMMDAVLGILVLRSRLVDLRSLSVVPTIYERTGLVMAREAMLYALGHEDAVSTEWVPSGENLEEVFRKWLDQPAAEDLPPEPEWFLEQKVSMQTRVLGCQIELIAENHASTILLGESLLAFIESFFSTVIAGKGHFASQPYLKIELRQSAFADAPFTQREEEDDCGEMSLVLVHPTGDLATMAASSATDETYLRFLLTLALSMRINFHEDSLKKLLSEERAQDRAALSARSVLSLTNILSDAPKYQVDSWIEGTDKADMALRRTELAPALAGSTEAEVSPQVKGFKFPSSKSELPPELSNVDAVRHSDIRTVSLINVPLWDRAKWKGMGFTLNGETSPIPGLVFAFGDMDAGVKIFRGWRKKVGPVDTDDRIGVTIIRGVDRINPAHYRVVIGLNERSLKQESAGATFFTLVYRIQEMTPMDTKNLDQFIHHYEKAGRYMLAAAQMGTRSESGLLPYAADLEIEKSHLNIVDAWKIGEGDPIRIVLGEDDDPVIPADAKDPPISKWFKKGK
jgi:hypothetical protein